MTQARRFSMVITKPLFALAAPAACALAGLVLAGPVRAQEPACALNGVEPVPVMEKAKAAFLHGRYREFYQVATPYVPDAHKKYPELMGPLAELFPDGFPNCSTVLQRRDAGGMVQEVTMFGLEPPKTGMLSIILTSVPFKDDPEIISFVFNTAIGPVLDELR